MTAGILGRRVTRLEDRPLVTGRGRFAADMAFPRQLLMRIVRADRAHGRLLGVNLDAAKASPGVVAAWSGADVADLPPIDFRDPAAAALAPFRQPILAQGRVRNVGEPVAAIFAEDAYLAEDAAELAEIEIEDLPVTLDAAAAPGEFDSGIDTEPLILKQGYGDAAAAFAQSHLTVELDLQIGRHSGVPLETRGALARYDAAYDLLELHGAAKVPHRNRETLARFFGRPPSSIHLHEGHVGGGFGIRGELYPEDFLVLLAALRLGRPVKWIEDRREHLMAANQSRQQRHRIRAAVDRDGTVTGVDDDFFHDQVAYVRTHGARVVDLTIGMLPGPYRFPAFRASGHVRLTNKTPAATYRSPGRYEGTFVRERLMDVVAHRLGLDPVEVRRRNLIAASEMPFARGLGALGTDVVLDSGDYAKLLDKALARFGWEALQVALVARRKAGEMVGAGLGMFVEKSGLGPSDGVRISVDAAGTVEIVTGSASMGQGIETALAQICAQTLGVDYRRIRVVHGHTDRIEFGIGAHASRATVMTGSATHVAAGKLRTKALAGAAKLLQAPAASLDIIGGKVVRTDVANGPSVDLAEVARQLAPGSKLHDADETPGLSAEGWFNTDHMTYPYGVHLAVARVDAETGFVAVERYLVAYDVGRAVNPAMIEGQIAGGVAQGLGGALYEEFRYDERGEPLSVTFADYRMPTMHEVPHIDILLTEDAPSPLNPLGLKGAGEAGSAAAGAAIASAVGAAIGRPDAILELPITPQRLRAILRG